jgi:hypothetical protein
MRWAGKRVLLHASAGMTRHEYVDAVDLIEDFVDDMPPIDSLVRGAIVGAMTITGEIPPLVGPEPRMRGWWATDQYGWQLDDVVELPSPVPCKGSLGFWSVPECVARKLRGATSASPEERGCG